MVTTTRRVTMPMGPDTARNCGVLQITRAFLHLGVTIILRCLSLVELFVKERYHIYKGRMRNIPRGRAIAADAIMPSSLWQHRDETDCPSRN